MTARHTFSFFLGGGGLIGSLRSPDFIKSARRLAISWLRQPTCRLKSVGWLKTGVRRKILPTHNSSNFMYVRMYVETRTTTPDGSS